MEFLLWLEKIRTPILDWFFSIVTMFGEETLFIVIGVVFYWCVSKKEGYYLLSVGLIGTVINQFLKVLFRVPRPWIKNKNLTIVEAAREQATGYSFPSGHTQNSVGIFGGIALWNKNLIIRTVSILLCILVPFSRLYLGVHTPLDVGVSVVLGLILVFGLNSIFKRTKNLNLTMRTIFGFMTAISVLYLAFIYLYNFPSDVDVTNLLHGVENAYKMLGCILGLWLSFEVDVRYVNFKTESKFGIQILKLFFGFIILLAIKSGLKTPLYFIVGNTNIADAIRYFIIAVFAGIVWPITFNFWNKISVLKNTKNK